MTRTWLGWGCLVLLAGCAGATVEFEDSAFPKPLVEVMDLDMGLVLSDDLKSYTHHEDIEMYGSWEVRLGLVQPLVFHNTLGAMFMTVTDVDSATEPHPNLDAVLVPTIEDFQISIPSQTRTNFYEVWIKYRMQLYDNQGQLIAEWPLPAYGKANREDYGLLEDKDEPALEDATMLALRDAAASLSLHFAQVPPVKAWLANRDANPEPEPATNGPMANSEAPEGGGSGT